MSSDPKDRTTFHSEGLKKSPLIRSTRVFCSVGLVLLLLSLSIPAATTVEARSTKDVADISNPTTTAEFGGDGFDDLFLLLLC